MSQTVDNCLFYCALQPLEYQYALMSFMNHMKECGFKLVEDSVIVQQYGWKFMFVPFEQGVNDIGKPLGIYCKFNCFLNVCFNKYQHNFQPQFCIYNLISYNKSIQLDKYQNLIKNFQLQTYLKSYTWIPHLNLKLNLISITFATLPFVVLQHRLFMSKLYSQMKKNFIQPFFMNLEYQDNLSPQNYQFFKIERRIHDQQKNLRKRQKVSNTATNSQIIFHQSVQKPKLNELISCKLQRKEEKQDKSQFERRLIKLKNQRLLILQLISQRQRNKQYMENQLDITIYQLTLNENLVFVDEDEENKKSSQQDDSLRRVDEIQPNINRSQLVQKRTDCICQGIKVLQVYNNNNGLNKQKEQTYLSSVQFIQCLIEYNLSIHSCTNQYQRKSQESNRQTVMNSKVNNGWTEEVDNVKEYKRLAVKRCLKMGERQFVNQYQFLKYIRHKVFPYISKYYLQQIPSSSFSSSPTQNEMYQDIIKKSIYMQEYQMNMGEFIISKKDYLRTQSSQDIIDLLFQLIVTLRYLQYFGILHRDIKLNNIMMDWVGWKYQIKLIDWGCAYRQTINKKSTKKESSSQHAPDNKNISSQSQPNFTTSQSQHKPQRNLFPLLFIVANSSTYIQTFNSLKLKNNQILKQQFNDCPHKFQTNPYFDIYSYGQIMKHFINEIIKPKFGEEFWAIWHLEYLQKACVQLNPFHRLNSFDIMIYLHRMRSLLKVKSSMTNDISSKNTMKNC